MLRHDRSRPVLTDTMTIRIRHTDRESIQKAAEARGMPFAVFVREVLRDAAGSALAA